MKQTYVLCVCPTWHTECPAHLYGDAVVKNSQYVTSGFKTSTFQPSAISEEALLCVSATSLSAGGMCGLCLAVTCPATTAVKPHWGPSGLIDIRYISYCDCKSWSMWVLEDDVNCKLNTYSCVMYTYNTRSSSHCCTMLGSWALRAAVIAILYNVI
jgi:hypothetical protein